MYHHLSLQELCRDLHHKIDVVDEARYDLNIKVARNDAEVGYVNGEYTYT